jgi:hypothetical protein
VNFSIWTVFYFLWDFSLRGLKIFVGFHTNLNLNFCEINGNFANSHEKLVKTPIHILKCTPFQTGVRCFRFLEKHRTEKNTSTGKIKKHRTEKNTSTEKNKNTAPRKTPAPGKLKNTAPKKTPAPKN